MPDDRKKFVPNPQDEAGNLPSVDELLQRFREKYISKSPNNRHPSSDVASLANPPRWPESVDLAHAADLQFTGATASFTASAIADEDVDYAADHAAKLNHYAASAEQPQHPLSRKQSYPAASKQLNREWTSSTSITALAANPGMFASRFETTQPNPHALSRSHAETRRQKRRLATDFTETVPLSTRTSAPLTTTPQTLVTGPLDIVGRLHPQVSLPSRRK